MKIELTNVLFFPITFGTRKELIKLMMRTFIFLFCTTLFSLTPRHARSQNDKIVIDTDTVMSVDEVFKIVKKQTDYMFVYHFDLFKDFPKVHLKKGVIRLNKLLDHTLDGGHVNIIFTKNNSILIKEKTNHPQALQRQVSGMVTNLSGLPLPGATVLIKGTTTGVTTDFDGRYSIMVPNPENALVVSFLGFETQEITVGNQTTIDVSLKESISALDEVTINAGYYRTSERERTGSISKIEAKDIEKQPVNNPLAAMQGRLTGVNIFESTGVPGGNYKIRIRGDNSIVESGAFNITTKNNPLYVVDGVPYDSETLESQQTSVSIIGSAGVNPLNTINPADIESIEVLKDADATAIYGSRGANGVVLITTKRGKAGKIQIKVNVSSTLSKVTRFVDLMNTEQYLEVRKEAIMNSGYTLETLPLYLSNNMPDLFIWDQNRYTDWQEVLIGGTAYRHHAQLSFSGGNEQTQFLLSGGYLSETTVFPGNSKYGKATFHFSTNHQSKDKRFKLNFSANYGTDTNNLPNADFTGQAWSLPPNAPALYNDQGNLNWENSTWQNPLAILETNYKALTHSLIANTDFSYRPIPALEFKTSLGYTDYRLESYEAVPHTSIDPNTIRGQSSTHSSIETNDGNRQSWIVEPQINWQKNWENASLKLLVGATFQKSKEEQLGFYASNFPSNRLILSVFAAENKYISQQADSEYKYQAFFSRINFNWQDKYILNLTGRRDGSSRFGPGKRFGNFGAVGAAWLFSEEPFLKQNQVLSFGKWRASYGITGSDNIGDYSFYDSYSVSGDYNGSGLIPTGLYNPNYSWESNKKLEAALELGFWQDRIFLSAAWYRNRSSNQLIGIPLPATTGFNVINANFDAIVENKGIEIDLRTVNIQGDAFKWSTTFNISANRNKLVAFPGLEGSTFANSLTVGEPLGSASRYHLLGVDPQTGVWQFEDYNNDGNINREDRYLRSDFTPKYFGGLGNTLNYKNLQLDVFFQFAKQQRPKFLGTSFPVGVTRSNYPVSQLDRWQQVGDENPIQRYFIFGGMNVSEAQTAAERYQTSDGAVVDGSFIRLRNVSLTYTVPKAATKAMDISIYLQGQNLLLITPFDGQDPERYAVQQLPPLRQLTLGLNVSF